MDKLKISRPILVEGKYDKIRLDSIVEGTVIPLSGFGIFKNREKAAYLRRLAETRGVIVLTDPDGAGRVIRGHLSSILPKEGVTHLYVPAVAGKEKRKDTPGKAGLLGVEGQEKETLYRLLLPFADGESASEAPLSPITKSDLLDWNLVGAGGAKERRMSLCRALALPPEMSTNALLSALNLLYDREAVEKAVREISL